MKTKYWFVLPVIALMPLSEVMAQGRSGKEHWKDQKEAAKKRDEYYRERDKKHAEYHREEYKREKEYQKEQAKRYKEYRKDRRDWDDDHDHLPHWADAHHYHADHHVYFRDYYTFYDPYRGGYVYLYEDDWRFSRELPAFLAAVDLGRASIQIMADVPLTARPEYYYRDYSRRYPRNPKVRVGIQIF